MVNFGTVKTFDLEAYLKVIHSFIDAEEVERALWLIDNVPAYYRDHKFKELEDLKSEIESKLITPHGYMSLDLDSEVGDKAQSEAILNGTLRGVLAKNEVENLNKLGSPPHIVDMGPGQYWLPIGLQGHQQFSYFPIEMDRRAKVDAAIHIHWIKDKPLKEDSPRMFVALEVIEHISDPSHIRWEAMRHCGGIPEIIHLSTPMYTYDSTPKNWRKIGLPHLRAYTPSEFIAEATRLFPTHAITLYQNPVMSIRGVRHDKVELYGALKP